MKKTIAVLTLAALAVLGAPAQTTTTQVPNLLPTNSPVQPFLSTLGGWVTSYNTNLTWTNGMSIDTGVATTTGQKIADEIRVNYNTGNWGFGVSGKFTGVGSAFDEVQANVSYSLVNKYDLKAGPRLGVGDDFGAATGRNKTAILIDPGIFASKLITANTYATVSYSFPVETVGKFDATGTFYAGVGFTF